MCGVQLKDRKRSMDLLFMLGLNKIINQFGMANSVRWYGHVLRRASNYDFEGQKRKGGQRGHERSRLRKKV